MVDHHLSPGTLGMDPVLGLATTVSETQDSVVSRNTLAHIMLMDLWKASVNAILVPVAVMRPPQMVMRSTPQGMKEMDVLETIQKIFLFESDQEPMELD